MSKNNFKYLVDLLDCTAERPFYSIALYKYRFLDTLDDSEVAQFALLVNQTNINYLKRKFPKFSFIVYKPLCGLLSKIPFMKDFFEKKHFREFIKKSGCLCYFSASNIEYKNASRFNVRKVVVIHDLKSLWEKRPGIKGYFATRNVFKYYSNLISSSSAVIAISNYTKKNILSTFPNVDGNKIDVVYNSVSLPLKAEPLKCLPDDYILYVNSLDEYKNIKTLIYAFSLLSDKFSCNLVIVGRINDYWKKTIVPIISDLKIEDRIIVISDISDSELRYCYENASLFVSPSLNEGFGYTPIEAAICGCPVICTKCEALPDTTMGELNYYDPPKDPESLANSIEKVLKSPPSHAELEKISCNFVSRYNPKGQKQRIMKILDGTI